MGRTLQEVTPCPFLYAAKKDSIKEIICYINCIILFLL